jgi:hypothetical protein
MQRPSNPIHYRKSIGKAGMLHQALILGAFNDSSKDAGALATHPYIDEAKVNPQPGIATSGKICFRRCRLYEADRLGSLA